MGVLTVIIGAWRGIIEGAWKGVDMCRDGKKGRKEGFSAVSQKSVRKNASCASILQNVLQGAMKGRLYMIQRTSKGRGYEGRGYVGMDDREWKGYNALSQ